VDVPSFCKKDGVAKQKKQANKSMDALSFDNKDGMTRPKIKGPSQLEKSHKDMAEYSKEKVLAKAVALETKKKKSTAKKWAMGDEDLELDVETEESDHDRE
jgi:hypothetical protein